MMASPGILASANTGAGGVTSLTFLDSATASGADITGPAGIQAGDLLVLFDVAVANSESPPDATLPDGFDTIQTTTNGNRRALTSCKIADGSEASASLTGMTGQAGLIQKILLVFRPNVAATMLTLGGAMAAPMQATNPAAIPVAASGGTPPLVVIAAYFATGQVNPRTFTPAKDSEVANNLNCYLAYKIYDETPQDHSIDMDDEGNDNTFHVAWIEVA